MKKSRSCLSLFLVALLIISMLAMATSAVSTATWMDAGGSHTIMVAYLSGKRTVKCIFSDSLRLHKVGWEGSVPYGGDRYAICHCGTDASVPDQAALEQAMKKEGMKLSLKFSGMFTENAVVTIPASAPAGEYNSQITCICGTASWKITDGAVEKPRAVTGVTSSICYAPESFDIHTITYVKTG